MPATTKTAPQRTTSDTVTPPAVVRAETNFLRFPFFALSTKDIHRIDFREVTGTRTIRTKMGESTVDFSYRVSRNTDHVFPGILSRNIHFALLAIMAKQSAVPQNPIRFSWRQLAREMNVSYAGGKMIEDMKQAIRSTHGTVIRTDHALIDGTQSDRPTIRRERGLYLYQDYLFQDESHSDGSTVDRNEITLSDWYFDNLKARYIQPLDFNLWLVLNKQTPIASRLYEYLTFVFGTGSFRRISYDKLAASIPVRPQKHQSKMKLQLEPAFLALKKSKVLKRVNWTKGVYGDVIVEFQRGESLSTNTSPLLQANSNSDTVSFKTKDSFDNQPPTDRFICQYYQQRFKVEHVVSQHERTRVAPYIERFGLSRLQEVLPKLVRRMKSEFPKGNSVLAALTILEQLLADRKTTPSKPSPADPQPSPVDRKRGRAELESKWASLTTQQQTQVTNIVVARLGKQSDSTGFRLMALHEANRLFFES
ncbi:MAG: hypothetical protein AAFN77_03070 [Planctomycetota bacterium]